jgi:adenosine deaminase
VRLIAAAAVVATLASASGIAQLPAGSGATESAVAARFAALRSNPIRLRAFLREMPKGGDLHNHLSGAVYAERYLAWAADDGQCLAAATMTVVDGPCDAKAGVPPARDVLQNLMLYDQAIDAMSMRHWNAALNGHDHFFAAFAKFGPPSDKTGDMLADVAATAAAEHVSYLELMLTPDTSAAAVGRTVPADPDLARWRDRLIAAGLLDRAVPGSRAQIDTAEARQREILRCGTPQADPGCAVTIRYIAQVGRTRPREVVFAQMVAWFALIGTDPRFVALNLVQPEDDATAVRDFPLHMSMLDFLHRQYPKVPIALHAGELVNGLVPPDVLRSHVRESIHKGHARRIGHATAAVLEDDPFGLLREMAEKKIVVEAAMSSADQILGVRGSRHPLRIFLEHGVPVTIATDDMGVSRSSLTDEFMKAVEDHDLDYATVKRMVRNSIEYAFADEATKARLKSDLERAFEAFERRQN